MVLAAANAQVQRYVLTQALIPPQALWRRIAAGLNRTGLGPNLIAPAAIDVAAWDLESRRRGLPLEKAMGGVPRSVPVYGSGGFTAGQSPEEAAARAFRAFGDQPPELQRMTLMSSRRTSAAPVETSRQMRELFSSW